VKKIWPSNVINWKKNICIMAVLMFFSISKSPNQANKKPRPLTHHLEHKWFWQCSQHERILLEMNRKKEKEKKKIIASNQVLPCAAITPAFGSLQIYIVCTLTLGE
jgi:hypothetical protein